MTALPAAEHEVRGGLVLSCSCGYAGDVPGLAPHLDVSQWTRNANVRRHLAERSA